MKYHKDMKIFIVGGGEIGRALAVQLARDGYELTVIDREESVVNNIGNTVDVISYQGNGASYTTLKELSANEADIFISVTESDELNILSCLTAHMLGAKHTIARVREVDYAGQNHFYRDKLGLSMTINPELATAMEVFRLLRFPLATRVEVFARGRAELVEMTVGANSPLNEKSLIQINQHMGINLLICAVVRNGDAYVPNGDTVIRSGDILYMTGAPEEFRKSFKMLKLPIKPMQSVMISGGGRISCYLAGLLLKQGAKVTIVERSKKLAEEVSAAMPKAAVLCDDTLTYFDSMSGSDISHTDAFIAMTENDEYNLIAAMYAESQGINKVVSRISAKSRLKVLSSESRICTVSREDVAADRILGYSRSLLNAEDNDAVESLYRLMDGKIEFIEFKIDEKARTDFDNMKYDFTEDAKLREVLQKIINFDGINIEIVGCWIWVDGNTYQHKTDLKELGFRWAREKKKWYFHTEAFRKRSHKTLSMDDIRNYYGSTEVETIGMKRLKQA